MSETTTPQKPMDEVALDLAQHIRDRTGPGFGNYPLGALYALEQFLPFVNVETRGLNGYNKPTASISELLAEIRERVR